MKKRNELKKIALAALALAPFAFAGCSARGVDPAPEPPRCELNANVVCASALENYLATEAYSGRAVEKPTLGAPRCACIVARWRAGRGSGLLRERRS